MTFIIYWFIYFIETLCQPEDSQGCQTWRRGTISPDKTQCMNKNVETMIIFICQMEKTGLKNFHYALFLT